MTYTMNGINVSTTVCMGPYISNPPRMEIAKEFNHVGTPVENPMEMRKKKIEIALMTGFDVDMNRNIVADATR